MLKYSEADLGRLRREWQLESEARFLAKERDWLLKNDSQEEEKTKLHQQIDKLEKSHESMKWVAKSCTDIVTM